MKEKIFKKGITKRLFSVVLALAMVLSLMPITGVKVFAFEAGDLCKCGHPFSAHSDDMVVGKRDGCSGCGRGKCSAGGYILDSGSGSGTHTHGSWDYTASGATLTAECKAAGDCTLNNKRVSLTLTASSANYSGSPVSKATLFGGMDFTAFNNATGLNLSAADIKIYAATDTSKATALDTINAAGSYVADLTVDTNKTATLNFTIAGVPTFPTMAEHEGCSYDSAFHFYSTGNLWTTSGGSVCVEGRWFPIGVMDSIDMYQGCDAEWCSLGTDKFSNGVYSAGWYHINAQEGIYYPCNNSTHTHGTWSYTVVNTSTLKATCGSSGCTETPYNVSLTLSASSANYSGSAATIIIGTSTEQTAWTGAGLTLPQASALTYTTSAGSALGSAPTTAGSYIAKLTVGDATAQVSYTISKAESSYPTGGGGSSSTSGTTPTTPSGGTIGGTENSGTNISVNTSNGNATVSNIPANTVNNIANNTPEKAIVIDVSQSTNKSDVTKVTIPIATIETIAQALSAATNNKESLIINTNTAAIKIDATALTSIAEQAKAGNIQLVVENKAEAKLNSSQKTAVDNLNKSAGKDVVQTFEAYFVSGGTRISSFGGGEISIGKLDFDIPAGKNAKNYHVYYISENGQSERYPTWVENGSIFFRTTHLSDYAIVYDEEVTNGIGKEVYRLWNPRNGDHLLTTNKAEKDACEKNGWRYEGVAFVASEEGKKVYRLYNPRTGEHFYTTNTVERDACMARGWKLEGVAFTTDGDKEVYRVYSGVMHHFTTSKAERDYLLSHGWKSEGVGFKAN